MLSVLPHILIFFKDNKEKEFLGTQKDCHTSKRPEYIDHYLQPSVKQISSYVQDATDFLRKLKAIKIVPND